MTTKEIVLDWLKSNGYYGLIGEEGCACDIEHLFACGKIPQDCEPGYRHPCHCKNGEHSCHIMPDKPKQRKQKATLELQQKERIDLAESKSYGFYPRIITIFEHDAEMAKCLEVSPIQPQHLRVDAFLEAVGQFERELTRMESLIELIDK